MQLTARPDLELYVFTHSPFCRRTFELFLRKGILPKVHVLDDDETGYAKALELSPLETLPILRIGGDDRAVLGQSASIAHYLDTLEGTSGGALFPRHDGAALRQALEVMDLCDQVLLGAGDIVVRFNGFADHPGWPELLATRLRRMQRALDTLSAHVEARGGQRDAFRGDAADVWLWAAMSWFESIPSLLEHMPFLKPVLDLDIKRSPALIRAGKDAADLLFSRDAAAPKA